MQIPQTSLGFFLVLGLCGTLASSCKVNKAPSAPVAATQAAPRASTQSAPQAASQAAPQASDSEHHQVISKGPAAGDYQAFPDATRLQNGDLLAVFYAGDSHVTRKSDKYPKAGRIVMVRSTDDGRTWSEPVEVYDDPEDNRDSHLSQLKDGTLIMNFFNLMLDPKRGETRIIRSTDNGHTWEKESSLVAKDWFTSAPVRELPDGNLILPIYTIHNVTSYRAGFIHSQDKGRTWGPIVRVGQGSEFTVNETDIVQLKDGTLYAALRGAAKENVPMHYTTSKDGGKTWTPLQNIGFLADSPSFTRLKSGEILMSYRAYADDREWTSAYTGFRISRDEAKTWEGPYFVHKSHGAYPSTIELKDGTILMVYYEEGEGSAIRAVRFEMPKPLKMEQAQAPIPVKTLPW